MMKSLLTTPAPIVLAVIVYTIFALPKFSKKTYAKAGRLLSILLLVSSSIALLNAIDSKVDAGRHGHHAMLAAKITKRAERLLEKGDCARARGLLNDFNKDYEIVSKDLGDLEIFVNQLLQDTNIPVNQSLKSDGS